MAIIVNIKNKKQEKAVTDFLNDKEIEFKNVLEEDAAIYKTTPQKSYTRLMNRLSKYEQMLNLKSDLTQSLEEVKKMRQGKIKKQPLQDFLNKL